MSLELVSCIIPVFNTERYLREAVESVLAQTYPRLEIIVVDDGSTDKSAEVAKKFGQHVQYVFQGHSGPAGARNTGINSARGEFLAFLDADDLWAPEKLSIQVNYLTSNPQFQCCVTRVKFFLEPGFSVPQGFRKELLDGEHDVRLIQSLVCRRNIFDSVGKFDASLSTAEDVDWFSRASDKNIPMAAIPQVLLYKRVHSANISLDGNVNIQNLFNVFKDSAARKKAKTD